jgi:hypothetical protein
MPLSRARIAPGIPAATYVLTCSPNNSGTGTLTNGVCRTVPWLISRAVTLTRIGLEVTTAGEVGSLLRLGIYADNGSSYPGALILDAGTVTGAAVGFPELTINQTLGPGIYWMSAATQAAPTTQPQVRQNSTQWTPPVDLLTGSVPPTAGQALVGYFQTATGALPAVFSSTVQTIGAGARIFVKTA